MGTRKSSTGLLDRVASVIHNHKLFKMDDKVIVAISGGADSLALLHILHSIELHLDLIAVYIDHGLRVHETPHEIKLIEQRCLALAIPFEIGRVDVKKRIALTKHSPEEAARFLRYRELERFRRFFGAQHICVGHTADDQVEHYFIRLIRGSGRKGLSGMRITRDHIVRPLLFENRDGLVQFLTERDISWCEDSSNSSRQYLRNRVRHDLLPLLENDFNPSVRKTVLQQMDILAEEEHYLVEITDSAYNQCVNISEIFPESDNPTLCTILCAEFLKLHPAIQRRIVEKCCWQLDTRPSFDHICKLIECVKKGENGSELHLTDGVRAEKTNSSVRLSRPLNAKQKRGSKLTAANINLEIDSPGTYRGFYGNRELILKELGATEMAGNAEDELLVDLEKITFPLTLRSALPGEKFTPFGFSGRKKISRYLNERKIPKNDRPAWPVLLSDNKVVALPGLQLDHSFRLTDKTVKILSVGWKVSKSKESESKS